MERRELSVTIIGCGWLGLALGKQLVEKGYSVNGSVRKSIGFKALEEVGIKPFALDLAENFDIPTPISKQVEMLVITIPPFDRNNPERYAEILRSVLNQFSDQTRVIFTSSTGIYPEDSAIYTENFNFTNEQESTALNLAENAIRQSNKSSVIFRLGGLIGPNRHPIRQLQGRSDIKNPDGPINFVHQGDCIRAMVLAIETNELTGTFNLVYPDHPSRKDYYFEAAKHYALVPPKFADGASNQRLVSSEKIMSKAGFEFQFPINLFPKLEYY